MPPASLLQRQAVPRRPLACCETPMAYVELKDGASLTAADLVAHCKTLLAGYKVPREIRFEPIPKTSTGKIQKFELRQRTKLASDPVSR